MEADGLSPSRIRQARQVLGALLTAAQRTGYIAKNVTDGIRLPREIPRKMRFLTAEQVESLVSHTPPSYQPLIYLLSYGGLRWGEAVALRLKNVRFERSRIDVHESMAEVGGRVYFGPTKTYEFRSVAVAKFLMDMLRSQIKWQQPIDLEQLVFQSPMGAVLRHTNFRRRVWLPSVHRAEVHDDLRIHELRHTCASLLIAEGAHPKVIQAHLGHSSITVTMDRYGHLYPSQMDAFAVRLGETQQRARAKSAAWEYPRGDEARARNHVAGLLRGNMHCGPARTRTYDLRIMSPLRAGR